MAKSQTTHINNLDTKITIIATAIFAGLIGAYSLGYSFAARNTQTNTVDNGQAYNLVIGDGFYGGTTHAQLSSDASVGYSDIHIELKCYQQETLVIDSMHGLDSSGGAELILGPTAYWQAGAGIAECRASAQQWDVNQQKLSDLASTRFIVFE